MGKLKKRADGRYQLNVSLPNGQRKSVYGRTQKEVQQKKEDLLLQYGKGITDFRSIPFSKIAQVWWDTCKAGKTGNSDQRNSRSCLNNHILPVLADFPIRDIRPLHIQKLLNDVGKSRSLQKHILSVLNGVFKFSVQNGLISGNPAQYVQAGGIKDERLALTQEQRQELLAASQGMTGETIILLAYYLGLRRGEIAGLHWTDFDKSTHTVHIQRAVEFIGNQPHEKSTKTEAGNRMIPVPDVLWDFWQNLKKNGVFVVHKKNGGQLTDIAFRRQLEPIYKKLSFKMTLHMLRHTYATQLDQIGVPPKTCQYLLGHASISTTKDIYTHVQLEQLEDARLKLSKL